MKSFALPARPLRPPFGRPILTVVHNEDNTISLLDHEGVTVAQNLTEDECGYFCTIFHLGVSRGSRLEREALIFEFTHN